MFGYSVANRLRVFIPAIFLLLACAPESRATISYEVTFSRPADHTFHISMTIPGVQQSVDVQMAAWDTLYEIRDFAHRVTNLHATAASGKSNRRSATG